MALMAFGCGFFPGSLMRPPSIAKEHRMPHSITLIPGDGTGPEISEATVRVPEATGVQFEQGDSASGHISELYEQGRMGRISEDVDLPLKAMSARSNRPCAETRSKERQ